MKRVLIITYYWPPSGGAGVQRWLKFAKYLPEYGWEPVILTVDPKDATYPLIDHSLSQEINPSTRVFQTKSRELFSLYKKVSGSEQVPHAGFAGESQKISFKQILARFIRGNFFLPDPRKGWNRFAVQKAKTLLSAEHFNCIVTTGPPHSTHLIGLKLSAAYPIPWIADFRDPWTDIYYYSQFYPTRLANTYNKSIERKVLKKADLVITVGPTLQKMLEAKLPDGTGKIRVVTNGFDPDDFKGLDSPDKNYFTLSYVGTIADTYPLKSFFKAASALLHEYTNMRIRFIGTISSNYLAILRELPQGQIEMIPYVAHEEAINYMSSSDALLLVIPNHSSSKGILTGKLFEYMAVGKPVLVLGPEDGDAANIIQSSDAGTNLTGNNELEIYNLIKKWYHASPKTSPVEKYNRKNLTEIMAGMLNSTVAK